MLFIKSAVVAITLLALSGCAAFEHIESSPMTTQLITNQITLRFIASSDSPVERASKVRERIAEIRGQFDGDQTYTLADISQAVRKKIDWQAMSPADQELLDFALTRANTALTDLIGEGVVDPGGRETIGTLLTWIDNAAMRVR